MCLKATSDKCNIGFLDIPMADSCEVNKPSSNLYHIQRPCLRIISLFPSHALTRVHIQTEEVTVKLNGKISGIISTLVSFGKTNFR